MTWRSMFERRELRARHVRAVIAQAKAIEQPLAEFILELDLLVNVWRHLSGPSYDGRRGLKGEAGRIADATCSCPGCIERAFQEYASR